MQLTKIQLNKIKEILLAFPEIKLAYLFGSQAREDTGPMSDYDFAVYLDIKDKKKMFKIKTALMDRIGRFLQTDRIDIVILNTAKSSDLKYSIITEGRLFLEKEPYKIIVEPRVMNEYFDYVLMLRRNNLTKA